MTDDRTLKVELIPIEDVVVVNPRRRGPAVFKCIVANIENVGLKRPLTVTRRRRNGATVYELVCGQGRLEAFQALGQKRVPAVVIKATRTDGLVMSLVENCARRNPQPVELLREVGRLESDGYSHKQIAAKTGLSEEYIRGICRLMEKGEERLLRAVDLGKIPMSVAIEIAETDDAGLQNALQRAYDKRLLRGRKLIAARRIIELRRRSGKTVSGAGTPWPQEFTPGKLVKAFREDVERKQTLIRKADAARDKLALAVEALRRLFADENFVTLLRAERLDTLPQRIADRVKARESVL